MHIDQLAMKLFSLPPTGRDLLIRLRIFRLRRRGDNRGKPKSVKALPNLSRFGNEVSTSFSSRVRAMNGAFDRLWRVARLPRWATSRQLLGRFGVPAMAIVGVGAITAVLIGVQCGGLDRCFAGKPAVASVAAIATTAAADAPAIPATTVATVPTASAAAVTEVAITKAPEVPEGLQRARRVDDMIGDTFVALASDDDGWLASSAADTQVYDEGDGDGPPPIEETAEEAATAAATGETTLEPLERPQPLDVAAFADEPTETAASVRAEAERKLAEVTKSEPAAEPEPGSEPEAKPAAEPKSDPPPVKAASTGKTRTVAGAGVNVRSGPGKSNSRAFGLAGGEKVTVGENQRGWLKITDDQGRTGWVYKDYLN